MSSVSQTRSLCVRTTLIATVVVFLAQQSFAQQADFCAGAFTGTWEATEAYVDAASAGDVQGTITIVGGTPSTGDFNAAISITLISAFGAGENFNGNAQIDSRGLFITADANVPLATGEVDFTTCEIAGSFRLEGPVGGRGFGTFSAEPSTPDPDPNPDPNGDECPAVPVPLLWVGNAAGEFDDPENWDEERVPSDDDSVLLDDSSVSFGQTLRINVVDDVLIDSLEVANIDAHLESNAALTSDILLRGICETPLTIQGTSDSAELTLDGNLAVDADQVIVEGVDPAARAILFVIGNGELSADAVSFDDSDGLVSEGALLRAQIVSLRQRSFVTVAESSSVFQLRQGGELAVLEDSQFSVFEGGKAELGDLVTVDVENDRRGFVVEGLGSEATAEVVFVNDGRMEITQQGSATFVTLAISVLSGNATDIGKVIVDNASLTCEEALVVGGNGEALLRLNDGEVTAGILIVGETGNADVELFGPISSLSVSEQTIVGGEEVAAITVDEGSDMYTGQLTIGQEAVDEGIVNLNGSQTTLTVNDATVVGLNGTGSLLIFDRAEVFSMGVATIGAEEDSIGEVLVSGLTPATRSRWVTDSTLNIGFSGKGDLRINESGIVASLDAMLGVTETGNGLVEINSGGVWAVNGTVQVGGEGIGTLILDPTASVQANVVGISSSSSFAGNLIQIGGDAAPAGVAINGSPRVLRTLQAEEEAPPGLYTQTLIINDGATFEANTVGFADGGGLGGSGAFPFDVTNLGRIAPGEDECTVGTFTVDGDYDQASNGALAIKVAGTSADRLVVEGDAMLGGSLVITMLASEETPVGESFDILTATSVTGTFENLIGPEAFDVEYNSNGVRLTILAVAESEFFECVTDQPELCGAGLCGTGIVPMLPLMLMTLLGWKFKRSSTVHDRC